MKKVLWFILLFSALFFFVFAIRSILNFQTNRLGLDGGLFTARPCKAPCWQNLIPGQSTTDDVNHFLKGLSLKDWPSRHTKIYETGCKWIRLADKTGFQVTALTDLNIENDRLIFIQSVPPIGPNLKQIVDHFGSPDFYKAIFVIGPDGKLYILQIYYPKQGIAFQVSVDEKDLGYVRSDMRVKAIEYYQPGDLLSYLTAKNSCYAGKQNTEINARDEISKYMQPWSGFGVVKVIQSQ